MYQGVLYVPKGTDLVTLRAAVHQIKYTCICFHVGLYQCKHSVSQGTAIREKGQACSLLFHTFPQCLHFLIITMVYLNF